MEQHERSSESCRRALDGMGRMFGFRRHPFRERPSAVRGQRGAGFYFLLGRLKPGVSKPQAAADATVIANQLAKINAQDYPEHFHVLVKGLGDTVIGRFESTLYTILAAAGLLRLFAACNRRALMLAWAPALRAARRDLNDPLRDSGKGVIGGLRTGRMRDTVVVAEVADAADRRGALGAELCSAARGAFWTAGGRRLTDTIAVA